MAETKTGHTCGGPKFGRKTPGCPRCDELLNGAEPRSWGGGRDRHSGYPSSQEIRSHDCAKSGCSIVCTFGDW